MSRWNTWSKKPLNLSAQVIMLDMWSVTSGTPHMMKHLSPWAVYCKVSLHAIGRRQKSNEMTSTLDQSIMIAMRKL